MSEARLTDNDADNLPDIYLRDLDAGKTKLLSVSVDGDSSADDLSLHPDISRDGRWVVFESRAENLVPEPTSDPHRDIYRYDLETDAVRWISQSWHGNAMFPQTDGRSRWPVVADGGARIAFESEASNLVAVFDSNTLFDVYLRQESRFRLILPRR